ncbi:MAG: helix-turn-helix domain-containing protein [Candidatus Woesearchaeota archaeon]
MDNYKTGQLIKDLLKNKKMTQDDLARELNISKSAVSKNLSGKTGFDLSNLAEISKLFGITLDELVFGQTKTTSRDSDYKWAVDRGYNGVKELFGKGLNLSGFDMYNKSILYYAIKADNIEVFKYLIKRLNLNQKLIDEPYRSDTIFSDNDVAAFIIEHELTDCIELTDNSKKNKSHDFYRRRNQTDSYTRKIRVDLNDEQIHHAISKVKSTEFLKKILLKETKTQTIDGRGKVITKTEYGNLIGEYKVKVWLNILEKGLSQNNEVLVDFIIDNMNNTHKSIVDKMVAMLIKYDDYTRVNDLLSKKWLENHNVNLQTIIEKSNKENVKKFLEYVNKSEGKMF